MNDVSGSEIMLLRVACLVPRALPTFSDHFARLRTPYALQFGPGISPTLG